jgi:general secretion pathway protein N
LSLVGTIGSVDESFGIFVDRGTKAALRLKIGEDYQGWTLNEVHSREVTLLKDQRRVLLTLPQPGVGGEGRSVPSVTQASVTSVEPARPEPSRRLH